MFGVVSRNRCLRSACTGKVLFLDYLEVWVRLDLDVCNPCISPHLDFCYLYVYVQIVNLVQLICHHLFRIYHILLHLMLSGCWVKICWNCLMSLLYVFFLSISPFLPCYYFEVLPFVEHIFLFKKINILIHVVPRSAAI